MQNMLFSRKTAAGMLGVSVVTLDRLRKTGILNFRQVGGFVRFLPKDIDDYLEKCESTGAMKRGRQ